ncbi:hypothetical protein [Polyangium aurulentum]|uniref:hypothetical protein n=1 Tax=Polyangium aurulentum TaxID=2567896 RepID=UPI0010AE854F|nr:hypothetical protein [Polyangium aurulentum]UQA55772.1 hypothetical protein E8A73_031125 [Polyangium aurulentum]
MSDPKNPVPGDRAIDLTDLELHDITPDMARRILKLRDGHPEAIQAVLLAPPAVRKQAGLSEAEVGDLVETWATYQRIEQVLPAIHKLVELLEETRLVHGANIAMQLGEMAHQVRRRSTKLPNGDAVLATFEALLDYQFGLAQTVADRRAKAKADAETPAQPPASQPA